MKINEIMPSIRLKREFLDVLDKAHWSGPMLRCYLYLAFQADPETGNTGYIPTGDIADETGIGRSYTYRLLKTLKECGAIVPIKGYAPRYHLPHVC